MMKTLLGSAAFAIILLLAPAARAQAWRVRVEPPAAVVETVPVAPSPRHVWIPGYHRWWHERHVWVPGRYEVPRAGYTRWEPHRWEHRGGYYHFRRGGWRR
jgi:hypothetical protein